MNFLRAYPKLLLLCVSMVGAYVLTASGGLSWLHEIDHGTGEYISAFIGGALFTFGFTAPFGVGVFVEISDAINPLPAAIIGGLGALVGDLIIFQVLRFELFQSEIDKLRTTRIVIWLHRMVHHERLPERIRNYLLWIFAGIVIASPLPDEFGVAFVSAFSDIRRGTFATLCFALNTMGIFILLLGVRALVL